jgi:hypothetical protein
MGQMPALLDEDPAERHRRVVRKRWTAVIIYMTIALVLSVMPLFIEWEELYWGILITVVVVGGSIFLIALLFAPAVTGPKEPVVPDGLLVKTKVMDHGTGPEPYHDVLQMTFIYYIMVGTVVLMMAIGIWTMDMFVLTIMGVTSALILVIMMIFGTLDVACDGKVLSFTFGPFGKRIPVDEVTSIRPTAIHALKDFMGWGVRVGTDGEIGYIVPGDVGVKVVLVDGKTYVVTARDPQALVDCVRSGRRR